ncbi:MAG: hypothetical protein J7K80_00850, partial [Candidatus Izimaplasma sp.]|nr:hypothetical protein [Candidatus Izimaplasma bacterium]
MGLRDLITNFAETSETHSNNILKTRYYRTSYKNIKLAIVNYAKKNSYIINSIDDIHGEIFVQTTKFHLIISVLQINPLETAVDVKVQTYKILGLNKPQSIIEHLFNFLDKALDFKG